MKSFIRNMLIAAVVFLGMLTMKTSVVNAAVNYNDYPQQTNVSPNKTWNIRFNNYVNFLSAQNNIKVYDSNNNAVPVTISVSGQSNVVNVKPISSYTLGKKYYIIIGSSIFDSSLSKHLSSDVRMYFTIKTKLDPSDIDNGNGGIPNPTGMVIIGKDRAYSVSYLLQHSDIANDVNGDPTKTVYYIPDASNIYFYGVKNLFGDKVQDYGYTLSDLHTKGIISDTITYTDAIGNNYAYVWNGYYQLQSPSVSVDVNLKSNTGMPTITVNKVMAVNRAAYYKIDGTNITRKIGDTTVTSSMNYMQKILIYSSDQTEIGYGYINISNEGSNIVFPITLEDSHKGNTGGNSNNNGSAVRGEDGYTYYLNSGDQNTLYKTDDSGEYNLQIGLDKAQYINEQSGWIYYSNYSDDQKIYRIKTDGSRREKVCDDSAAYLVVYGDWIYYSNHSQQGRLYRIGVSAGASTKDDIQPDPSTYTIDAAGTHGLPIDTIKSSQTVPYDEVAYINVVDDWIYFVNNSDDHKIYKVDLDGNFRTKVSDEWSACPQVVDNEIYYCSKTGEIMKIGTGGTSDAVDLGQQTDSSNPNKTFIINVSGDWIYYSNKNDNKTLYKVKVDGSGEKYQLTNFPVYYAITAGDRLYVVSTNNIEYTLPISTTGGDIAVPVGKKSPDNGIVKVNDITKVVGYEDVNKTIEWLEDKYLPDKVTAVMQDNTQQELTVSWDKANKTFSGGIYYYTGKILGYDKTVKLKLIIPSQMLNYTNEIHIINNPGPNDYVQISRNNASTPNETEVQAKSKDIIRVYADANKTIQLSKDGDGVVGRDGTVTIPVGDIFEYDKAIYVTIQRSGKYESNATKILQMSPPKIVKPTSGMEDDSNTADFDARDNDNVFANATGKDFTIYGWIEAQWDSNNVGSSAGITDLSEPTNEFDYMYILPSNSPLDVRYAKPIDVKNADPVTVGNGQKITLVSNSHSAPITLGNDVTVDSATKKLDSGYYSIYISRHYSLDDGKHNSDVFVTADPNGSRPVVTAELVTESAATEEVTSESVPKDINVKGVTDPNGDPNNILLKTSDKIVDDRNILSGEQIWFVPDTDPALNAIKEWLSSNNQGTGNDTPSHYLASLNNAIANRGIVVGNGQNNFDSTILQEGTTYHVFVLNSVGSKESINTVTVDSGKPTVNLTTTPGTGNKYDSTSTDVNINTINITYNDPVVGRYGGSGGTIYILAGDQTSVDATTIKNNTIRAIQARIKGVNYTVSVAGLTSGNYPITIVAVDAAGNISAPIRNYTVSNITSSTPITPHN